ncbi:MAG TPA: hypothetical protein VK720_11800 [Terracidiphilus sp.]|jgi:hypothetical protein|nr:hypothetical protein [Terracidiphilus sp.]
MGLGPIIGFNSDLLPAVRKPEEPSTRFEIEGIQRAGDERASSQQQAAEREHREHKDDTGDLFQATVEDDGSEVEAVSQVSEEGHDWFV